MENARARVMQEDRFTRLQLTVDETHSIVKELQERFDATPSESLTGNRKQDIRRCQTVIRKVLQTLSDRAENPLVLQYESYDDEAVQRGRDLIVREVLMNHSNKSWANTQTLNDAFKQVWKNKRDDHNREITGKKDNHRANNRRNKRRMNKLKDRLKALENSKKPDEWRKRASTGLTRECTSPDISDDEEPKRKLIIPIVWESHLLSDIKEHLDVLRNKDVREDHPTMFTTMTPSRNVPDWAIRGRYRQQRGNSTEDLETTAILNTPTEISSSSSSSSSSPSSLLISSPSSSSSSSSSPSPSPSPSPASCPLLPLQSTPLSSHKKRRTHEH